MANVEINDLTAKTTPDETDELEIQETAGGLSKKITRANFIPDASTTVKGKVELATNAETTTGTDTERATTPAGVKAVADTKANTSHSHAAADVTSGLLANGRIATGTPDGTKFLRDDQVWTAIPGGGDALTANPLSQFAATTSAQLRGVLSDETGTGAAVFGTSPNITTPTGIVKGDVGLGNVDNTSDANKPISTATQAALDAKLDDSQKGASGGLAELDGSGLVPTAQLPSYVDDVIEAANFAALPGTGVTGKIYVTLDDNKTYRWSGSAYVEISASLALGETSATAYRGDRGKTAYDHSQLVSGNPHSVTKTEVGLGNVDNTSDASKPVSIAQQTALDLKANDADVVHDTGDETIAGVKTFSSDPIIPDEAYDATAWNGSLEPPTKNAVRDKFESLGAGGGQTTYDAIVAPSGGDYTTLGAAIAAASAGWSIFVKEGTYSESAITSSLANLTIVGENPATAIIALTTVNCVLSGANVNIRNLGFTGSSGALHLTGAEARLENIRANFTAVATTTATVYLNGSNSVLSNSHILNSTTSGTPGTNTLRLGGDNIRCIGNYIFGPARTAGSSGCLLRSNGQLTEIIGNVLESSSNVTGGYGLTTVSGAHQNIANNIFTGFDTTALAIALEVESHCTANGNTFKSGRVNFIEKCIFTGNRVTMGAYTGVSAITDGAGNCIIANNFIAGAAQSSTTGITVSSGFDRTQILGNHIESVTTGISIAAATCDQVTIANNNFTMSGITTAISDSGTGTDITGNTGTDANLEKRHMYLKNTSGATINAGNVVTFKSVAAGNEITTSTTAGDNKVIGMAVASITNTAFGLVQVSGKTTLLTVNGTTDIAVGDYLSCFTTAGIAQKATAGHMAFAIALEAYTTDDSNGVIDALIISPRLI